MPSTGTPDEAVVTVDGQEVRRCPDPPAYPLQMMLAVFDFPDWSTGDDDQPGPVAGRRLDQRGPAYLTGGSKL